MLGPFRVDEQEAMFGSWVAWRENQVLPPGQAKAPWRPVTAKIFGGSIYGDGLVLLGSQPSYRVRAKLDDADLATCARELPGNNGNLRGRVSGDVAIDGFGQNRGAMRGSGHLHLSDADIYQLPAMISMLKILSIKAPDPNAFSQSDIDFHVKWGYVYFDKLDFKGDAISLLGKGEMNFLGDTDMVLAATVGHADAGLPALRNFFSRASQQIMQIHVRGNVQNPDIRLEPLPGVNQALKNLDPTRSGQSRNVP